MDAHTAESASLPPSTLWLSRHVYWCKVHSTIIVLDLARDRYLNLRGNAEHLLAATVRGWPEPGPQKLLDPADHSAAADSRFISNLITQGVLTRDAANGKDATPTQLNLHGTNIALDSNVPRGRRIRLRDVVTFLAACLWTFWSVRCRSLQSAVDAVAARNASQGSEVKFDAALAADLVAIFRRLRSFTFSAHRRCLFHALALVNFLSRYGVYPQFVMGVKIEPWAAHSWVQWGEYVLDGTPEQVRFYTAILVA